MRKQFDAVAWGYDLFMRAWGLYKDKSILRLLNLSGAEVIADLGGGTGHYATFISPFCREVTVVDESTMMLARIPHTSNVNTIQADITTAPLPDDHYDVALLIDVLHHLQHKEKALENTHRILKSGGQVLIMDFNASDIRTRFLGLFEKMLFKRVNYLSADGMANCLTSSGFSEVTYENYGWYYLMLGCKK